MTNTTLKILFIILATVVSIVSINLHTRYIYDKIATDGRYPLGYKNMILIDEEKLPLYEQGDIIE